MESLLKPDVGLMFWTVITFFAMVLILKKVAWSPILKALEEREDKIKSEIESAQNNRAEMERLKQEYERQMSEIEARSRALLSEAEQKSVKARETILKEAQSEARLLADKTRKQLESEKERLMKELRSEVGDISVEIAEKLMRKNIDRKVQEKFIQDFLNEIPSEKIN